MGFCFFNSAAIAARHAQKNHGIERAAVVDFDVHHGNGSQEIFWSDRTVMYASTHQMPLYPGTGAVLEGGDDLEGLANSASAHVTARMQG